MKFAQLRNRLYELTGLYVTRARPSPIAAPPSSGGLNFTDLLKAVVAVRPADLTILQVGAFDGVSFDPVYAAAAGTESRLLLVEPNHEAVARLKQSYAGTPNVQILQGAVVETSSEFVPLYKFSAALVEAYPDFGGTSSLSIEHLVAAYGRNRFRFNDDLDVGRDIVVDQVRALTFAKLKQEIGHAVPDVVVIDTEGADWKVLQGLLREGFRPRVLQFESRFLSANDYEVALVELYRLGYTVKELGDDAVAIRDDFKVVR